MATPTAYEIKVEFDPYLGPRPGVYNAEADQVWLAALTPEEKQLLGAELAEAERIGLIAAYSIRAAKPMADFIAVRRIIRKTITHRNEEQARTKR